MSLELLSPKKDSLVYFSELPDRHIPGISEELQVGKAAEHLVCADLILQGFNAFLADQGLPMDVIVETGEGLKTIQVKATQRPSVFASKGSPRYRFQIRKGRAGNGPLAPDIADYMAFVALDIYRMAYIPTRDLVSPKLGTITMTQQFISRVNSQPIKCYGRMVMPRGRYFEDYAGFPCPKRRI